MNIIGIALIVFVVICFVVFVVIALEQKHLAEEKIFRANRDSEFRRTEAAKAEAKAEAKARAKASAEAEAEAEAVWAKANPEAALAKLEHAKRLAAARAQICGDTLPNLEDPFKAGREYKKKKRAEAAARDELAEAIAKALRKGR